MQTIHYLVRDNGDGSSSVRFCDSAATVQWLIDHNPDSYPEGSNGSFTCQNFSENILTLTDVQAEAPETVNA